MAQMAVVQMNSITAEIDRNLKKAGDFIAAAAAKGAQLVVLPELFATGYRVDDYFSELAEPPDGKTVQLMAESAGRYGLWIAGTFPEKNPNSDKPFNTMFMVNKDGLAAAYRKVHLWGNEPKYFTPGNKLTAWRTPVGRIGMLICYDISFPEPARAHAVAGADLLLYAMAFGPAKREYALKSLATTRALENTCYVGIANRTGTERESVFCGQSRIVAPDGSTVVSLGEEEAVAVAEIDLSLIAECREKYPYLKDRSEEVDRF